MMTLEIAQNISEVNEGYDLLVAREVPGFQIAPDVDIDEAKQTLENRMSKLVLGFMFDLKQFVNLPPTEILHIDTELAKRRRGLNLHENVQGEGVVDIIAVRPSKLYFLSYLSELGGRVSKTIIDKSKYYDSDIYRGKLEPGIKTVFSEGIRSPMLDYEIGPSAHRFTTSPGSARTYNRYLWSGDDSRSTRR
jgi:hypothetical protein